MLYVDFARPDDTLAGVAIYDDESHNSTGPLVVMDWDVMHRLILEMHSLRDQRDVNVRRASLTLVPDIMDMATARDEMPTTMEEYRIMADKEANDE